MRTFVLTGTCGIPSTAKALAVNFTVVDAAAQGFLKAYAANQSSPTTSVINFLPAVTRANNAIVSLATDASGGIKVENGSSGTVHVIIDVVGYFE
jgi:hypothetical protein